MRREPSRNRAASGLLTSAAPMTQKEIEESERCFAKLIKLESLDDRVRRCPKLVRVFEQTLGKALMAAYPPADVETADCELNQLAHLFLQRVLYSINRLKLFWFDELSNYGNERSLYLHKVRDRIETPWQIWELKQLAATEIDRATVCDGLLRRAELDVSPPVSSAGLYFRHEVNLTGYRHLLAIASLDGLVEASQLSRVLGGVSNEIHSMMTRLLVEEYGGGRLGRKHSTFFAAMLTELHMRTEPEAYFDVVPWEVLAAINHSFLMSERKRFYLRYVGGLLFTEISVPAAFDHYRAASERLHMSAAARGYWDLHIKEDIRHGQWMLDNVALPLATKYPEEAWEIILGYDQQKWISERSGASIARSVRAAERAAIREHPPSQSAA